MSVIINNLEIENVKRVKAVQIRPDADGLTVIGGKNDQGKTSVLDSIIWALGGNKYKPSQPHREGSVTDPHIKIELSNGLVVERKGKNSTLKVIDQAGNLAGQQLLDEFISQLALNLPKFMESSGKEKADTLLKIIGVGDQLFKMDREIKELYDQRHTVGRIANQKVKHADELPVYPDAPKEPVSVSDLIKRQQAILAKNGENQKKRDDLARYEREFVSAQDAYNMAKNLLEEAEKSLETAKKSAEDLMDESTAEIEASIADIEAINEKVRTNQNKVIAQEEAAKYEAQYKEYTQKLEDVRAARLSLLKSADLPLEGLTVEDGELIYLGQKWDGMSSSQQLKVAVAIVRKLNPNCGFVLIDKLEQMDLETMKEFGDWLKKEGLQAIATRVSSGSECQIIIEDGYSSESAPVPQYKAGEF